MVTTEQADRQGREAAERGRAAILKEVGLISVGPATLLLNEMMSMIVGVHEQAVSHGVVPHLSWRIGLAAAKGLLAALEGTDPLLATVQVATGQPIALSPAGAAQATQPDEPDLVLDILTLAAVAPPIDAIARWTSEQRSQAIDWAGAVHLDASDNDIAVPPMPDFVKPYEVAWDGSWTERAIEARISQGMPTDPRPVEPTGRNSTIECQNAGLPCSPQLGVEEHRAIGDGLSHADAALTAVRDPALSDAGKSPAAASQVDRHNGQACGDCGGALDPDQCNAKRHGLYVCQSCIEDGGLDRIAELEERAEPPHEEDKYLSGELTISPPPFAGLVEAQREAQRNSSPVSGEDRSESD